MIAFILGIWTPLTTISIPASLSTAPDRAGVLAVAVPDHESCLAAAILEVHDQVPGGLDDPGCGRVSGCAQDPDAAGGVLDDRQHEQVPARHGDRLEEIAGEQGSGLGAEEIGPGGSGAAGCRVGPVVVEDLPYGGRGDLDAEDEQFAVDAAVAPGPVLHTSSRTSVSPPALAPIVGARS